MSARRVFLKLFFLALFVLAAGCDSTRIDDDQPLPSGPLFTVLEEANHFDSFPMAASRSDLGTSMGGSGAATFFIPDDEAFDLMSPETLDGLTNQPGILRRVLLRHVVQGSVSLEALNDGDVLQTAEGTPLGVTVDDEGSVFLDGVRVEEEVGTTSRGPVYRVKSVFRNHLTVEERVTASPLLQHASRLFQGMGVSLSQEGTFFIPIDRGFEHFPGGGLANFDDPDNGTLVQRTLSHLVVPDRILPSEELASEATVTTLAGSVLRFQEEDDVIDIASGLERPEGEAKVLARDLPASNGVFHLIEQPIQGHLSLWERVDFFSDAHIFADIVGSTGMQEVLHEQEGLTLFVPLAVEDTLGNRGVNQLFGPEQETLRQLLAEFHVSPVDIPSNELVNGNDFSSLAEEDILVRPHPFMPNEPHAVAYALRAEWLDLPATNGRLHLMKNFLNPRSLDLFDQLILSGFGDFRALVRLTNYEDFVRGPDPVAVVAPSALHPQLFQADFSCRAVEIVEDHLSTDFAFVSPGVMAHPIIPVLTPQHSINFFGESDSAILFFPVGDGEIEEVGWSEKLYLNFPIQNGSWIHAVEEQFRYARRQNLPPC